MAKVGRNNDFNTENEFEDYIIKNAVFWVKDFFNKDFKSIERQWYLSKIKTFGANKPRIDLFLNTKDNKKIGIELKNPKNVYGELSRTISQLLSYAVIAMENGVPFDELAIITSKPDDILIKVIKKYNLPIRVFVITRNIHYEII